MRVVAASCLFVTLALVSACKKKAPEASKPKDAAIIVQGGEGFVFFREGENITIKKCPRYTSFFAKDGTPKTSEALKTECNESHSTVAVANFRKQLSQALKLSAHYLNPSDRAIVERYKVGDGDVTTEILQRQRADIMVELQPIRDFIDSLASAGVADPEGNLTVEQMRQKKELEAKLAEIESKIGAGASIAATVKEVNLRIDAIIDAMISAPGITKESVFIFSRDGQGFIYNILASYVQNVNILGLNIEFAPIPTGSFIMGSPATEEGRGEDEQAHKVNLLSRFEIMITEVTQKTWFEVMGDNPARFRTKDTCPTTYFEVNGTGICPYHPVEGVSWERVQEFIRRINATSPGAKYRLPTEAEWEYAARNGATTAYARGNDATELKQRAWYGDNASLLTHPVASKEPTVTTSGSKIFDLQGNVWEWTNDWYGSYPNTEVTNPKGPDQGDQKVIRGCAWSANAANCRFANREREMPQNSSSVIGFRLVREAK